MAKSKQKKLKKVTGPEKVDAPKPESPKAKSRSLLAAPSSGTKKKAKPQKPKLMPVISTPTRVIVHLMRHAEAQRKSDLFGPKRKDPSLSDAGKAQCSTFIDAFKDHQEHVTHILCSPMKRAIHTAITAFPDIVGKTITVYAMPELQSLDKGPAGVGANLSKLAKKYRGLGGEVPKVDVVSFGRQGWNDKDRGAWSPGEAHRRVDFIKGFLRGLLTATMGKIIEVVIITHRSFLRQLCRSAKTGFMAVNTCALYQDGQLRLIGDDDLKKLRDGESAIVEAAAESPVEGGG